MTSLNKVTLIGHLGKDVDLRYLSNGDAVANFSLATTERWHDKQTGEKKEQTEWHQIVAFKKLGEICGHFLRKGSLIYCEGKLKTEKYQDKDGIQKYSTKIIIDEMKMLDKRQDGEQLVDYSKIGKHSHAQSVGGAPIPVRELLKRDIDELDDDIAF